MGEKIGRGLNYPEKVVAEAPKNRAGPMISRVIRASVLVFLFIITPAPLKLGLLPAVSASESAASGSQLHGHNEGSSFKVYGRAGGQRTHKKAPGKSTGAISEEIGKVHGFASWDWFLAIRAPVLVSMKRF